MQRDRAFRLYQRRRAIDRKVRILGRIGGAENIDAWTHGEHGRLAKGKIHCSCWMCRSKSYDELHISEKKAALRANDD